MAVIYYNKSGVKQDKTIKLDPSVFGLTPLNHELLDLAYRSYLANGRAVSATTLKRGEVRGGGKKPWRQKGTGRARVGSIRVPNWRGGGVVFGPSGDENYSINLPLKMRRLAIRQALSAQAQNNQIIILESFEATEKVKNTIELLGKVGAAGNILLVLAAKDAMVERATRNIGPLTTISAKYLNVYTVLNADLIIVAEPALAIISDWLGESEAKAEPKAKAAAKSGDDHE